VNGGSVRLNGQRVSKASAQVKPGDVLTFPQGKQIRVVAVQNLSTRRGPAPEARLLYEDRTPPVTQSRASARSGPRPTKKDRRDIDNLDREAP